MTHWSATLRPDQRYKQPLYEVSDFVSRATSLEPLIRDDVAEEGQVDGRRESAMFGKAL